MTYRNHFAILEKFADKDVKTASALLRKNFNDSMEYHIRKMSRI